MTKIYTKTGDGGETGMLGGKRVSKSCLEMDAIGEVDELNANLGLLISELAGVFCEQEHEHSEDVCEDPYVKVRENLTKIQNNLFVIGANLAALQSSDIETKKLENSEILVLENWIDEMEKDLPELKNFILPTGDLAAAQSFVARAICRRAERVVIKLFEKYTIDEEIKKYLNRLSDCLFVLGRWINFKSEVEETKWRNN